MFLFKFFLAQGFSMSRVIVRSLRVRRAYLHVGGRMVQMSYASRQTPRMIDEHC